MKNVVVKFGLIAGAVLSASMLLSAAFKDQIGFEWGAVVGYTSMVAAFLTIYFAIRSYRDTALGGAIRFWPAVRVGLLVTLIASTCYVATWQFVYRRMLPDFGERYIAYALEKSTKAGATADQLAQEKKALEVYFEDYKNPVTNVAITYLEPLPVALIMTLVSAGMLSRKRRDEDEVRGAARA